MRLPHLQRGVRCTGGGHDHVLDLHVGMGAVSTVAPHQLTLCRGLLAAGVIVVIVVVVQQGAGTESVSVSGRQTGNGSVIITAVEVIGLSVRTVSMHLETWKYCRVGVPGAWV
jgi:hypothetical protein